MAHQIPLLPASRKQSITSQAVKNKQRNGRNSIKLEISHLDNLCLPHLTMKAEATNPLQIPPAQAMVVGVVERRQP